MSFYLLQENGSRILLENSGSDAIILQFVPTPTVVVVGGDDSPAKRKRRKTQQDLFLELDATIHQLLAGEPDVEVVPPVVATAPGETVGEKLESAFSKLVLLTAEQDDWTSKIAQLRTALNAYQQQIWDDDEAEWLLLM